VDQQAPAQVVLAFMDRINTGDVDGIVSRMTDDHIFVDGLGNRVVGKEKMRGGWKYYLSMFPDYRVSHEDVLADHSIVVVFGSASGTLAVQGNLPKENHWDAPAAWKAVVRDGKIAEWHVYCDNQAARKILGEKTP
jgi:ketosteroid isomerase-like protein